MHLTGLDFFLWAVSFLGNLGLLFVLCYRPLAKSFPLFTSLALLCVIRAVVMYFVLNHGSKRSYLCYLLVPGCNRHGVGAGHRVRDCQSSFPPRRRMGARRAEQFPLDGRPEHNRSCGTELAGKPAGAHLGAIVCCLLYTSPSPRDRQKSRMPSSA